MKDKFKFSSILKKEETNFFYLINLIPIVLVFITLFTAGINIKANVFTSNGYEAVVLKSVNYFSYIFDGVYSIYGALVLLFIVSEIVLIILEISNPKFRESLRVKIILFVIQILLSITIFLSLSLEFIYIREVLNELSNLNPKVKVFYTSMVGDYFFGIFTTIYLIYSFISFVIKFDVFNNTKKVSYEPLLPPSETLAADEETKTEEDIQDEEDDSLTDIKINFDEE